MIFILFSFPSFPFLLPPVCSRETKEARVKVTFILELIKGTLEANLYFRGNKVIITVLAFPKGLFSAGTTGFLLK